MIHGLILDDDDGEKPQEWLPTHRRVVAGDNLYHARLGLPDKRHPASTQDSLLTGWLGLGHAKFSSAGQRCKVSRLHCVFFPLCQSFAWRNERLRLGRDEFALEAAHIHWHCYDGPDDVVNGLAMCSFRHAALGKGALGVEDNRVIISAEVHDGEVVEQLLFRYGGQPLRRPQRSDWQPEPEHFSGHRSQVFRDPRRG